ncbi:MAG: hypothetical protein QXP68_03080 [Thermosphaera sp.]
MVSKRDLVIVEKYVFLGSERYRVNITGTNIVINVKAGSEEEALEKALLIAEKIKLTDSALDKLRKIVKNEG